MFGVSMQELIIVGIVALIVLGPERLPKAARELGKLLGGLRRQTDALRREFYNSVYTPADDLRREIKRDLSISENTVKPQPAKVNNEPNSNCSVPNNSEAAPNKAPTNSDEPKQ